MRRALLVLSVLFVLSVQSDSAEAPNPAQIEQRLREISLEFRVMEADLKAAQLTIQNIQLRAPQLRAEEEALRAELDPKTYPKPPAKTDPKIDPKTAPKPPAKTAP